MFIHRLKYEFFENFRLLAIYGLCYALNIYSHFMWWFSAPMTSAGKNTAWGISLLSLLGICSVALWIVATLFKRDDLKHPSDFESTRPIRPLTLFGTKLAFTWLFVIMPTGIAIAASSLASGLGIKSIWIGLIVMAGAGFACALLAASCMAHAGRRRSLAMIGAFVAGLIGAVLVIELRSVRDALDPWFVSPETFQFNLIIALSILCLSANALCISIARKKHTAYRARWFILAGAASVLFVSFAPLPKPISNHIDASPIEEATTVYPWKDKMMFGRSGPVQFFQGGIIISSALDPIGEDLFLDHKLEIVGDDDPLFQIDRFAVAVELPHQESTDTGIGITYKLYERDPSRYRGYSTDREYQRPVEPIKQLPKKRIRIKGSVRASMISYREIHRAPLGKSFSIHDGPLKVSYSPADKSDNGDEVISCKLYSPIPFTTKNRSVSGSYRLRIEHPLLKEPENLIGLFEAYSESSKVAFGECEITRFNPSLNAAYLHHLREKSGQITPSEWMKQAELVVETTDKKDVIIPVDVEVEVPDPIELRKLMKPEESQP